MSLSHVAVGRIHTCALAADSTAYCWGDNALGQLGLDTLVCDSIACHPIDTEVPLQVSPDLKFLRLDAGVDFTCGLTANGEAYCWGKNHRGQLGDGTQSEWRAMPGPVQGGHTFVSLSTGGTYDEGGTHACAVTADGEGWCWGGNDFGQLGDGTTVDRLIPVKVAGTP
jgi:alpha-tubulin suppressor-like RCC1 family protein